MIVGNIFRFVESAVQRLLRNPSFPYLEVLTYTVRALLINNLHVDSCVLAASDIDAASTLMILLLPRLVTFIVTPPLEPRFFRRNIGDHGRRILNVLNNCWALETVEIPLEFLLQDVQQMVRALKRLRHLSTLEFSLPTTFTLTPRKIERFQSLFAIHLRGFDQIKDITLPIQLIDNAVLQTLASLPQLARLNVTPLDNSDGQNFALLVLDSDLQQSPTNFPALRTVDIGLHRVPQLKQLGTMAIIKNRLGEAIVI
ncbi:hypothetical protein M413DRAFT_30827 [Hebeloma cylindrosporum]|uniref:Uncharacterized protein n=1 Tax=Hebeloma cylindrosporum TaxID=76867 RepID=A0A0C3C056_HEBCY|nr:hypothetical protein M413DRAFT_30827 [Hebeloma cylindrosporum h7]